MKKMNIALIALLGIIQCCLVEELSGLSSRIDHSGGHNSKLKMKKISYAALQKKEAKYWLNKHKQNSITKRSKQLLLNVQSITHPIGKI